MKIIASVFAVSILATASGAYAQDPAPSSSPPPPPIVYHTASAPDPTAMPQESPPNDAPASRTGFQMALRTGYMLPMGSATGNAGDAMSNTFGGQVPLLLDIGGKPEEHVFIGGYLGLGLGGAAGTTADRCSSENISCSTATFRIGFEAQAHFAPAANVNPWIGYGIGLESTAFSASGSGGTASVGATGFEFAHFMAGVDFRVSHTFGIGPVLDLSFAEYTHESITQNGTQTDGDITNEALHEWLMLGARVVFFP